MAILEPLYTQTYTHLSQLNRTFLEAICQYLGITTKLSNSWDYSLIDGKSERLAELAASMIDAVIDSLLAHAQCTPQQGVASYYSKEKFVAANELDLEHSLTGRQWLDLLRGKTFLPHGRNAYLIEGGKKYYVSIVIEPEQD